MKRTEGERPVKLSVFVEYRRGYGEMAHSRTVYFQSKRARDKFVAALNRLVKKAMKKAEKAEKKKAAKL